MTQAAEDQLVVPPALADDPRTEDDCIMLVKQWVRSIELAQPPLLVLPAARLARLQGRPKALSRNK
eukprot:9078105-Prorocentrum_lima.AAC.1